jgi:hypothetical protein
MLPSYVLINPEGDEIFIEIVKKAYHQNPERAT